MATAPRSRVSKDGQARVNAPGSHDELMRQLDELQRISADNRKKVFGDNWFKEIRDLYNMPIGVDSRNTPTFRPRISVPQIQMLSIQEASDLSDNSPKLYITNTKKGRDRDREYVMNAQWRQGQFNLHLLYAQLWAMLNGTGFIQLGYSQYANNGRGAIWLRSRDPETVLPDPAALDDDTVYFISWEDRLYRDEIVNRYPERGRLIPEVIAPPQPNQIAPMEMGYGLQFTPGPMQVTGGLFEDRGPTDGRLRLRTFFINDSTTVDILEEYGGKATKTDQIVPARFKKKYPNGRMLVECAGIILFDGDNPFPNRRFPITRLCSMPPITGYWSPSPVRYVRELQYTAQRMFTQNFENAVRLNNGVWFIDEATGLSAEDFGGIPAEVRVINSMSRIPQLVLPKPFPPHMLEYPKFLLGLMKEMMGFTASREGKPGAGNVGADLFDAAIFQSQAVTRMRAKLLSASVQRVSEMLFEFMCAFPIQGSYPTFGQEFKMVEWSPIGDPTDWNIYLDPGSIRPISAGTLKKMVPGLKQEGLLDTRTSLEMLDVPGAGEIADNIEAEKVLEALARTKRGR